MLKRIAALWLALLLAMCMSGVAEEENLLHNPGFEWLDSEGSPVGWFTDAYRKTVGYTLYSVEEDAHEGERAVSIENLGMNDARFAQTVTVEPDTIYRLSGWIRAEEIPDSGHGANLSIADVYVFSRSIYESDGWEYVECYGITGPEQTEITVFARVGGYSGESMGKASFDSIALNKVDKLPSGAVAVRWYQEDDYEYAEPETEAEAGESAPFWPALVAIAAVYLLAAYWLAPHLLRRDDDIAGNSRPPLFMWLGLGAALLMRVVISLLVEGYPVDVGCFLSWGGTMANVGPTQFYQATSFCDYPPAYVFVLGLNSIVGTWAYDVLGRAAQVMVFKLVPMACDIGCAYIAYHIAREGTASRKQAGMLSVLVAFCPVLALNSAAWCQMDSVLCLCLMLVAYFAIRRRWALVMPVYMLAVLIKPQALMLGFLGLTAIIVEVVRNPKLRREMLIGVAAAIGVALVVLVPFSIHQPLTWVFELYKNTLESYPYATLNTTNLYYLVGGNWSGIGGAAHWLVPALLAAYCVGCGAYLYKRQQGMRYAFAEPLLHGVFALAFIVLWAVGASWGLVGAFAMAYGLLYTVLQYLRGGDVKHLPLLGALLFLLLYAFGVKMHERYLLPALVFFGMAFVIHRDKRILLLMAVLSCTMFINEGIVLDNAIRLGSSMGHLNNDTYALNMLLSVITCACVPLAVWTAHDITVCGKQEETAAAQADVSRPALQQRPGSPLNYSTDASLHWRKLDWALMLGVTIVYAVVALTNLGSFKAPQNPWKSTTYDETVTIDLGKEYDSFTMLYFAQVSYDDFIVATSDDGEGWTEEYWAEMAQGQCYRWKYLSEYSQSGGQRTYYSQQPRRMSGRYVQLRAEQVGLILNEVIFRDADGNVIPAAVVESAGGNENSPLYTDPANLLDEQDTLEGEPGWFNSTYFDEIYHARTAHEHLQGSVPYETTHPPLGKVLMAASVAVFGMTPFGWRFAGALAGILMLPGMYLLGKQLTKRSSMAFAAMFMMAVDCMHFTQTRIATIDSFPVLFIIFSYFFMLRFMQRDAVKETVKRVLPDLAWSGLFMGLAVSSKWIGAYAGVGLAVLFFYSCYRHLSRAYDAKAMLKNGKYTPEEAAELRLRAETTLNRIWKLCLWCLLFFVAVPVAIYLLSYIPHFAYAKNDAAGFIKQVIKAQEGMLSYHATPQLGMDHPFYSPWYEWPLNQRPMYYAMAQFVPVGYSYAIFCFGNPAVWLTGLAGIAWTLYVWARRHCYTLQGAAGVLHGRACDDNVATPFILIGLLAQFLPWVLVPRGTYIYHYFASIPFLCLGTMVLLHSLCKRYPRTGKWVTAAYLAVCLGMFIAYYPYASGVLTPTAWLDFMKQFLRIYY